MTQLPNPIPNEARTPNVIEKRWCRNCRNDGMIECSVGMVPCPFCQVGFEKEFQKGSPWGHHGFWASAPAELADELVEAENQRPVEADVAKLELEKIHAILHDVEPKQDAA